MQHEPIGPVVRDAAIDVTAADGAVVVVGELSVAVAYAAQGRGVSEGGRRSAA